MTAASSDADDCAALVRDRDYDRYATTLFAPVEHRQALLALFAFNAEVVAVATHVSQPLAGEIRLQWWDDALAGKPAAEAGGHPVAAQLLAAVGRYRLPVTSLRALVDAHRFDLYDEPMQTVAEMERYLDETAGQLFMLGTRILGDESSPPLQALVHHASLAHGLLDLIEALPQHAANRRLYLPHEMLDRFAVPKDVVLAGHMSPEIARLIRACAEDAAAALSEAMALLRQLPLAVRSNFLLLALGPIRLSRLQRAGYDPFRLPAASRLSRLWTVWRGSRAFRRL